MNGYTFYFDWEVHLMMWLQAHMGALGKALASFFTLFGEEFILVALVGFLYWCYDKKCGKYVAVNLVVSAVWNPLVKNIFLRRRPYFDHAGIRCLRPVKANADLYDIAAQGYSFPSGHSMSSMSAYGSVAMYKKRRRVSVVFMALVCMVGISRFCLGVHYPTDVLVGWFLGVVVILAVSWLQKRIKNPKLLYLLLIATGIPGWFYCTTSDYFTCFGLMVGMFAGFLFEEHFINFENTREPLACAARLIGGILIFLLLNYLLKLPFSSEFLSSGTGAAHGVRTLRYAITCFVAVGVYPMTFRRSKGKSLS